MDARSTQRRLAANVDGATLKRLAPFALAVAIIVGWTAAPVGLFTVDEYFYARMAGAMAQDQALTFEQFDLASAPALDMAFAKPAGDGARLAPQYPSGYAIIAAPFYALFGLRGLFLINALAGVACIFLTLRVAKLARLDDDAALAALGVLAFSSFWAGYLYAIWPHMLAAMIFLAVIERLLKARAADLRAALGAGLLVGFGETVRIDMIVLAPAAIAWFRLFCTWRTRALSAAFAIGLAPGLAAAAAINFQKFGVFNPFTYENSVAANDPADFYMLAAGAATALVGVLVFDFRSLASRLTVRDASFVLVALAGATLLLPQGRQLLDGLWYTLVDAQSYSHLDRQVGIERNESGWLVFYGFSKKALAESLPWIAVLIFPVIRLAQGKMPAPFALFYLAAGAVVTLYSYNETDSGLGLNARFLLPILPLAAIIFAAEAAALMKCAGITMGALVLPALVGFAGFFALRSSIRYGSAYEIPLDLYPQLAIACVLLAACVAALKFTRFAKPAAMFAALSVGAAAAVSATDFTRMQLYRAHVEAQATLYAAALPRGALLFSTRPALFAAAGLEGISVAYPGLNDKADELAVVAAFQAAGRCAYAQGREALSWRDALWAGGDAPISLGPIATQGPMAAIPGNPLNCPH